VTKIGMLIIFCFGFILSCSLTSGPFQNIRKDGITYSPEELFGKANFAYRMTEGKKEQLYILILRSQMIRYVGPSGQLKYC